MILLLPILVSFLIYIILDLKDRDIINIYSIILMLIYYQNISIGLNNLICIIILLNLIYKAAEFKNYEDSKGIFNFFLIGFSNIFIFYANSLYAVFISIELISFIMITYINLYINNKYPGILYYLLSTLFSILFIYGIKDLYFGYTISYVILSFVFIYKLGLGPLHILMPKIYNELSPKNIFFIDILTKFFLFSIFYRLFISISINLYPIIIISIIIGVISSLNDNGNLINLLIYSSLINYGFILILVTHEYLYFFYLTFYSLMVLIYLHLITTNYIHELKNKNNQEIKTGYIIFWFILILNLIGVPPLIGFWIKLYMFYILVLNNLYFYLFIILISLIIISFVYIRILLSFFFKKEYKIEKDIDNTGFSSHLISTLITILIIVPAAI